MVDLAQAIVMAESKSVTIVPFCPENHLQTNKQIINLLYIDVKNLTSIMRCCMWSSSQNDTKGSSPCDNLF